MMSVCLLTHCARHSGGDPKPMHGNGKAAIAQGPDFGGGDGGRVNRGVSASRVKSAESEIPGLAPIVQAPGSNDDALLRSRR